MSPEKNLSLLPIGGGHRGIGSKRDAGIARWEGIQESDRLGEVFHVHGGHVAAVSSIALSASGEVLASGSRDGTVRIWDLHTGRLLHSLVGHTVALSASGEIVASGLGDTTVKIWDARTGQFRRSLENHTDYVSSVALSASG